MRLRYTVTSPFARKVRVVAHELGLSDSIELVATTVRIDDPAFWADNPVAKVPVLITRDGQRLADSNVICEYLNAEYGGNRMLDLTGPRRWQRLTLIAMADAVVEAGIIVRQELSRPVDERLQLRIEQEMAKVSRGLDAIAESIALDAKTQFDLASAAIACAVGWLELRFGSDFLFKSRPKLSGWWQLTCERPSVRSTHPSLGA